MGYPIPWRNTREVLEFFCISASDKLTGVTGIDLGSLFVRLSKNGAAFAAPAGALFEIGYGKYGVEPNATDADTIGPLSIHVEAPGCVDFDDTFDVGITPGRTAVEDDTLAMTVADRIVLGGAADTELAFVKAYLRVEHEDDDDIVAAIMTGAKVAAEDFLNNPFSVMRSVVLVSGAEVGDRVGIDGKTFRIAAEAPASRSPYDLYMDFAIGGTDAETAANLAEAVNDSIYGALDVFAVQTDTEVALLWRTRRAEPVPALEVQDSLAVRTRRTLVPIPQVVHAGVLRTIAALYDQRQDFVASQAVTGDGALNFTAPPIAQMLWRPHRKNPGT